MAQAIGSKLSIEQIRSGANELVRKNNELMREWRQLSLLSGEVSQTHSADAKAVEGEPIRGVTALPSR